MADSILRLRVQSDEYDQKIKRAAEGIQQYAQKCRDAGGTLQYLDDGVLEFVQALGKMDTVGQTTKQQLREMTNALTDLTATYRGLTDEEKASPFGQALAKSIDQLTERAGQARDAMADVQASIQHAASDTRLFDQLSQGTSVMTAGFQGLTGAGKLLGIEMGNDVEVIAKLQAAMAVTNSLTTIQTALQKQSALMQGVQAAQTALATAAQTAFAAATGSATAAQAAFNVVAKANPYVLLATAIVAVGGALWAFSSASSAAEKEEEDLAKAAEKAAKKAEEMRTSFVNASAQAMNTASRLSSLQMAYKNANSEMEKTSILKEAQKEFKNLGIECKGLVDAQNLLINQGGQIIEMIRLQGDAAAIAALRMEAFKKSFSMLLENGYDANAAAILAGYNAQVQDLDGQLTKIQTRIQTIKGGLPTSGGDGGSRNTDNNYAADSIIAQEKEVQRLTDEWKRASGAMRDGILKDLDEAKAKLDAMKKTPMVELGEFVVKGNLPPLMKMQEVLKNLNEELLKAKTPEAYQEILSDIQAINDEIDSFTGKNKKGKKGKEDKEEKKYLTEGFAKLTSGISGMASGFEALGIDLGKDFKEVIGGIQGITSILTAISTIVSAIEVIAGADALIPLAGGGIVPKAAGGRFIGGNSFSGDNVFAGNAWVNSGELVLNRAEQGNLAAQLTGDGAGGYIPSHISGEQIWVVLNRHTKRKGMGEIVTWK